MFANKLIGLSFLTVSTTDTKILKVDLIEHKNKLKIKAFSKGRSNIILYNIDNSRIYDVVSVNIHPKIDLNKEIVVNKGCNISLLEKEKERKAKLLSNNNWISENPEIFSLSSFSYSR